MSGAMILLALLMLPCHVWAAGALVGVYIVGDAEIEAALNDDGFMRISALENGQVLDGMFMLLSDNRRWLVVREGGQLRAYDAVIMTAAAEPADLSRISVTPTGVVINVAGYEGAVYEIDDMGDKLDLVLSDDNQVARLSPGVTFFFQDMQLLMFDFLGGAGVILEQINKDHAKPYGLLAFDEIRLKEISRREVAEDMFKLPANVEMVDMREFLGMP